MASTFSPSLRLELIGDGDQSGIWGQTTNNNLGGLIEQAIGGVVTITLVDANYTLTNFNGVVDEARNAVIIATGALSAQRNIIAPLVEKTYIVRNNTTGGFGVQIIGPSGTGVIIPNGVTTTVYCDGTNFLPASTGSTGNQSINGNLLVTGTTTLVGALGGSTAVFSGAISSVNPSFTGTPTAPTATAGTNTTQIATTAFVQGVAGSLGTMSTQNANNVAITGGTINGTTIGATTAATIRGTTGTFTGALSATSGVFSGAVSGTTGTFSGAVSGTTGTFSGAMSAASLAGSAAAGAGATGTWNIAISGNAATATNATNATAATQNSITSIPNLATVGTITSGTWSGSFGAVSGANLTSLNASNLASGTVPSARLTGTYAISISGNAATATTATTASNANAVFGLTKLGLGITGEVWNNVTGSRATNTLYTNSRTYPIMVSATGSPANSGPNLRIYVNGMLISSFNWQFNGAGARSGGCTIVPAGATYQLNFDGSGIENWVELY